MLSNIWGQRPYRVNKLPARNELGKRLLATITLLLAAFLSAVDLHAQDRDKNPIIFVHGYFDVRSEVFGKTNFGPLKDYLTHRGWAENELYTIQYSSAIGCNIDHAHELSNHVHKILKRSTGNQVDIVAHSMGGLSARYYTENLLGHVNVGALITLGTPHHGTPLAYLAVGQGGRQMQPGSEFLQQLNRERNQGKVRYTSIYTYSDELVPWRNSRMDGWKNIGGWYNLHWSMLFQESVHRHVARNLTGGISSD